MPTMRKPRPEPCDPVPRKVAQQTIVRSHHTGRELLVLEGLVHVLPGTVIDLWHGAVGVASSGKLTRVGNEFQLLVGVKVVNCNHLLQDGSAAWARVKCRICGALSLDYVLETGRMVKAPAANTNKGP